MDAASESRRPTLSARRFHECVAHWAAIRPDGVAIDEDGRVLTYAALDGLIDEVAAALSAAGLRADDRIMIVAENTTAAIALAFAANRIGACCSILNARMKETEVRAIAAVADPRMIAFPLTAPEARDAAGMLADAFDALTLIAADALGEIRACPARAAEANDAADDLGLIMFTSGTTGTPKGVMLTNATLLAQAEAQCTARDLTHEDTIYLVAPIAHSIGFSSNVLSAFAAGGRLLVAPRFQVANLVDKVAAGEVTMLVAVPQLYTRMLDHIAAAGVDMSASRLRVAGSGGASLDPDLKARGEAVMNVTLSNGYGATEFVPVSRVPMGVDVASNVVGLPSEGVEIRIVDEDGNDAPVGEPGEIWVRGPFRMKGYFRNPEESDKVFKPDGWLATGDLGEVHPDGMLAIVGRRKEIIIRSGFNVYPADVEAALTAHETVSEAAVVGRAVPGNEEVVAFVTPAAGREIDPEALRAFVRGALTDYKAPSEIIVIDAMPIGPTGKIQKALLKERL